MEEARSRGGTRLLLELGRGGMGVVYLALSERTGGFRKLKVVKRLRPDLADDPRALAMFQEEARLSASLHHPNIVQTNEVGFDGRYHFLEMEYLEGASLHALQRRAEATGGLALPLLILVLTRALAGLAHAHTAKDIAGKSMAIVHRDVSPHNVFVTYDGGVKLLDFGIAKAADSAGDTETGVLKGKVAYMAPEQAARKSADARADIFAVGVILWQAVAKRRLWEDEGDFEIYMHLREGKIPSLADAAPDAPKELVRICMRALEFDPAARWASAKEMEEALEAYLAILPEPPDERQLAARVRELFAEDRARRQADIEEQSRETADRPRSDVLIPRVSDPPPPREGTTGTGANVSTLSRREPGMRRATMVGIAAAVVGALAIAVAAARVYSRGGTAPATSTSAAAAPSACISAADCGKKLGKVAVCRPQGCVALETEDCKLLAEPGDAENDRTIWIGAMMPLSGPQAALGGAPSIHAIDLARRDFLQISHGIPSARADAPVRPLAVIACDDAKDATASARHLAEELHVPAVIGFASSQEVIDLSRSIFLPKRVLVVASLNMSALITSIPQPPGEPRLVWRTSWSTAAVALPTSRMLSDFAEPRVRASTHLARTDMLRVGLVRHGTTAGLSFADSLVAQVRFNGKSALENGSNFREFVLSAASEERDAGPDKLVDDILEFRPHVILAVGQSELTRPVIEPLERAWPHGERFRPLWLSPNSLDGADFFRFLGTDAERRRRFFGIAAVSSTMANLKFTNRYNETFADKVSLSLSPSFPYDAMYLLGYAAYAAGDVVLTGPNLARAIARLVPPGKSIDVGATRIFDGFEELRAGRNIDLNGSGGRLDFDLTNGESTFDFALLCVGLDAKRSAFEGIESGLSYDAVSQSVRGTLACP